MTSYKFLLDIALILLTTKFLGLLTEKFYMPQVVGALLAGLVLGPAVLGWVGDTDFLKTTAEIGVVVLMFNAGMETNVSDLKACGKSAAVIALIGVIVPLLGGFGLMYFFNGSSIIATDATCSITLQNLFIGVVLTATSVSITVETLKELGKLNSKSGNAVLAAAVIDDILGIIALTLITAFADSSVRIVIVLLKIVGFFVFAAVAGVLFYFVFKKWYEIHQRRLRRHTITAFVFCLIMSFVAEHFFGVADITGAYLAGIVISCTGKGPYISKKFEVISYLYLSPVFFASIGLKITIQSMPPILILFTILITIVAVITKIVGCGLGAKMCGYNLHESLQIGSGMISRGEVALIILSKGSTLHLVGTIFMAPIVLCVAITTIVTPIILKIVYRREDREALKNAENTEKIESSIKTEGSSDKNTADNSNENTGSISDTKL